LKYKNITISINSNLNMNNAWREVDVTHPARSILIDTVLDDIITTKADHYEMAPND